MKNPPIKSALGLNKFCRTSPLLDALRISKIANTPELQELSLLKTMFISSARTQHFYRQLLHEHNCGINNPSHKDLISRVNVTCHKYGLSLVKYLCDDVYAAKHRHSMKRYSTDGLVGSVKYMLSAASHFNRQLLNMLLSSF